MSQFFKKTITAPPGPGKFLLTSESVTEGHP